MRPPLVKSLLFTFIVPLTIIANVARVRSLSFIIVTAAAIVMGSVILGSAYSGEHNIMGFLLAASETSSNSPIGVAEAATLPLDVKQTFRLVEKSGDAKDNPSRIKIDSEFIDPEEHCEFCYRIEIDPGATGKTGAMLKANKLFNLEDAQRLILYARGEVGGEDVRFNAAGKYVDRPNGGNAAKLMKFAFASEGTNLDKQWQRYEMDLSNTDLTDITHGFGFEVDRSTLKESGKTIVIYLKGITFDDLPAKQSMRASPDSSAVKNN